MSRQRAHLAIVPVLLEGRCLRGHLVHDAQLLGRTVAERFQMMGSTPTAVGVYAAWCAFGQAVFHPIQDFLVGGEGKDHTVCFQSEGAALEYHAVVIAIAIKHTATIQLQVFERLAIGVDAILDGDAYLAQACCRP